MAAEGLVPCRNHNSRGRAAVNVNQRGWEGNRRTMQDAIERFILSPPQT